MYDHNSNNRMGALSGSSSSSVLDKMNNDIVNSMMMFVDQDFSESSEFSESSDYSESSYVSEYTLTSSNNNISTVTSSSSNINNNNSYSSSPVYVLRQHEPKSPADHHHQHPRAYRNPHSYNYQPQPQQPHEFVHNYKKPALPDRSLYLGMDCEMVERVGTGESVCARVVLVDFKGVVVLDSFVHQEASTVADYRTYISGITAADLETAPDITTVRAQVLQLIAGKILVGHGLENDLKCLGIVVPWHCIRDTAYYEPFMQKHEVTGLLVPRRLRDLAAEKLNRSIQNVNVGPHNPAEDAQTALDLYKRHRPRWEACLKKCLKQQRKAVRTAVREQLRVREELMLLHSTTSPCAASSSPPPRPEYFVPNSPPPMMLLSSPSSSAACSPVPSLSPQTRTVQTLAELSCGGAAAPCMTMTSNGATTTPILPPLSPDMMKRRSNHYYHNNNYNNTRNNYHNNYNKNFNNNTGRPWDGPQLPPSTPFLSSN